MKATPTTVFTIAASALVLTAVVAGVSILGSPSAARARQLDAQRVLDLQGISSAVERYRRTHDGLPESLSALRQSERLTALSIEDPDSREAYAYRVTGASTYELCAHFGTVLDDEAARERRFAALWQHPAGRHCFSLEARPPAPR